MSKQQKNAARHRWWLLYTLIVLAILLVTATYTWFSLSRSPRVSELALYVNAPYGLELSSDYTAGQWVQQLDYAELLSTKAVLKPATWSDSKQRFFAAAYGVDGRLTGRYTELSDERNANRDDGEGYYIHVVFYARAGAPVTVSLSPAVEIREGEQGAGTYLISTPVWNAETLTHESGGEGAEYAARIGLRVSKLDLEGEPLEEPERFFVYEPNCNGHAEPQPQPEPEGDAADRPEEENPIPDYTPTPSIDGTPTLVPEEDLILQSVSEWTEADPVQRTVVLHSLGEFLTQTELFSLEPEQYARLDLYVWLEGQDPDLTNFIGQDAQLFANLQFASQDGGGGGLVPIPDE